MLHSSLWAFRYWQLVADTQFNLSHIYWTLSHVQPASWHLLGAETRADSVSASGSPCAEGKWSCSQLPVAGAQCQGGKRETQSSGLPGEGDKDTTTEGLGFQRGWLNLGG